MKPMLVRDGDWDDLDRLIDDPNIAFQRKYDGHRRPVVVDAVGPSATIVGLNREGGISTLPGQVIRDLNGLGNVTFDAELLVSHGGGLRIFDLPRWGTVCTPDMPLRTRLERLAFLFEHHQFGPSVQLVATATTAPAKRALIEDVEREGGEGWVAKPLDGAYRYVPKGRTPWIRFKRRADIDCVVMARGRDKDHLVLGLYNEEGVLVPVGTVTAAAGDGPRAQKGDVVKVLLMGVTPGGRLREPTYPVIRKDKPDIDCTFDQMDGIRLRTRENHGH